MRFSAVKFIKDQLKNAILNKASDIHFEAGKTYLRIRIRIDGLLHETVKLSLNHADSVISRLKIMANLNIFEKRLPQDGHFNFTWNEKKYRDCRLSSCPSLYGEKMVVRILSGESELLKIDELGLLKEQEKNLLDIIQKPQGLILVTGPTGSGKTITLYSIINYLNEPSRNISTIEDPVEIELAGINQINVNAKISFDFALALRTLLRQDPDIILIGEIRDQETAKMAIRAAETGHLVLASLHTNSAYETFNRLQNLGIKKHHLLHSVRVILGQRLLRRLCVVCKSNNNNEKSALECNQCLNGYQGRIGVFELFNLTEEIKNEIHKNASFQIINKMAIQQGFLNLEKAALIKQKMGLTTLNEIARVII